VNQNLAQKRKGKGLSKGKFSFSVIVMIKKKDVSLEKGNEVLRRENSRQLFGGLFTEALP